MSDPTPAATARELAQEVLDTYAAADHEDFTPWRVRHDRLLQTCRDIIALAAPAPTPSEPVAWCAVCGDGPDDGVHKGQASGSPFHAYWPDAFTPGARDE